MIDLSQRWPIDVKRRDLPLLIVAVLLTFIATGLADSAISRWATSLPEPIVGTFHAITDIGLSEWYLVPSLVLLVAAAVAAHMARNHLWKRAWRQLTGMSAFIFLSVGLTGLASNLIKRTLGRPRPELLDSAGPFGLSPYAFDHAFESFPSGHTTTAFSVAMVIGFLWPRAFWPALVVAVLVAVSRVVVGAHYPTDALSGMIVGVYGTYALRNYFASRRWLFQFTADGRVERRGLSAMLRAIRRNAQGDR